MEVRYTQHNKSTQAMNSGTRGAGVLETLTPHHTLICRESTHTTTTISQGAAQSSEEIYAISFACYKHNTECTTYSPKEDA